MAILVGPDTRVVVQGMTGREGEFHSRQMLAYGTKLVAGVTPGKGGTELLGVPIFDTVRQAVSATGANASVIFVPPRFAADAILEAADAGIGVIVCITDGIPAGDMVKVVECLRGTGITLIGPNCPGLLAPGICKMGIMPGHISAPGPVGVVSRSGTLTYEIVASLTRAGLGQSTCIGVGGDPILGSTFADLLPLFEADPQTRAVVLIGEIGGSDEEIAAEYIRTMTKPVVAFISGRSAPPGKRMGHAGAIISGSSGTPEAKVEALLAAGAKVANATREIPDLVASVMPQA
ncbi:MAG: succinate--CoA ligase subunit alpha [Armatimonadota bacterium]